MTYKKLLKQINSKGDKLKLMSISADELTTPPNKSDKIRAMYIALKSKEFIELIFGRDSEILYIERLPACLAYKFDSSLSAQERWTERLWGFMAGIVVSVIAYVITTYLVPLIL